MIARPHQPSAPHENRALGLASWALYDWANSPFTTLIITFIFPTYLQTAVFDDPVSGQVRWGWAISLSGIAVALLAPVLGAVADAAGRRKPWVLAFTMLCVTGSAFLWFTEPSPEWALYGLVFVATANIGFEFGTVFSNAMLPDIVPDERVGRLSGWAWGLGYAGGLAALVFALMVFIWPETPPLGLDRDAAEQVRAVGPLCALWLAVFALPLFLFTPDRPATGRGAVDAVRIGLRETGRALTGLRQNRSALLFLISHMIYADGLLTLFAFGGLYAAGAFGLSLQEVVVFGIAINVAAGIGAFGFAWFDDWVGSKPTIMLALVGLIVASVAAIAARDVIWLWVAGISIGLFAGPAQAASRSLMARIAPVERRAAYFGLFALSGKATAFLGPAIVAFVTEASGSQRVGLSTIIVFLLLGLVILISVKGAAPPSSETGRGA